MQAMKLDPGEDIYPANRANVYLKMKKWEEAETDCTEAVKLDPKASKVATDFLIGIYLYLSRHLIGEDKPEWNYKSLVRL